jgi:hypothetical protein
MNEVNKPWVHDLLQIDPALLTSGCGAEPHWIQETLIVCPWVVVRRAQTSFGRIAVGVRGATRSERWAAFCDGSQVRTIVRPEQLLPSSCRTPALRALHEIRDGRTLPYLGGQPGALGLNWQAAVGLRLRRAILIWSFEHRSGFLWIERGPSWIAHSDSGLESTCVWKRRCAALRLRNMP